MADFNLWGLIYWSSTSVAQLANKMVIENQSDQFIASR